MDTILFVFDRALTATNGNFTVMLTPVKKTGGQWQTVPGRRIFQARDLPLLARQVPDKALFKTALENEMALRKTEGRFLSQDQEFTRLRLAPRDLFGFVAACQKKGLLIDQKGRPTTFDLTSNVLPELAVDQGRFKVFIEQTELSGQEVVFTSMPVTLLRGNTLVQLTPALSYSFLKAIPCNRRLPGPEREALLQTYVRHPDKLRIRSSGKSRAKIIQNLRPRAILNLGEDLKKAELFFDYRGVMIRDTDTRNPVHDLNKNLEIHRDPGREDQVRRLLPSLGFFARSDEDFNWFLARQSIDEVLPALKKNEVSVRLNKRSLTRTVSVRWSISTKKARILVGGRVIAGDMDMGLTPLLQASRENRSWFKRPDGSYGLIGNDLQRVLADLTGSGTVKGAEVTFARSDFAHVSALFDADPLTQTDEGFEALRGFASAFDGIRRYPVPGSLAGILRPYQVLGYNWLRTLRDLGLNGILADDMGLGKSLQVLTLITGLSEDKLLTGPVLLIAPKTLLFNWELEIKRFAPDLSCYLFAGSVRSRDPDFLGRHHIILTSYGLLRTEITLLCSIGWDSLILDEAQAIKNPHALVSKAVKRIPCPNRIALTGTPVENAPSDLWSQFDFLMPGFLGGLRAFKDTHGNDPKKLVELRQKTKPYILRRLKTQVLEELPPKTDMTLYCDFSDDQRSVYDQALVTARQELAEMDGRSSFKMLRLILRLRLIACHPSLAIKKSRRTYGSGKLDAVCHSAMEILSEGHKILIFSQFTRHLKLIESQFHRLKMPSFYLDGKTTNRAKVVRDFQNHPGPCPFFISLKTGGTGLNLSEASYVFLLDPWWNPAVENQAIDRCHRMGQKQAVTVYRFITRGSIEEKVNELKLIKKEIEETLIETSNPTVLPVDASTLKTLLLSDIDS